MIVILAVVLLAYPGTVLGEEITKQGSASDTTYYTSTWRVLEVKEGYAQMNYDARGIITSDNEAGPNHHASTRCLGAAKVVKAEFKEFGYCISTRPDGDQVYSSYEGKGKAGLAKGTFVFAGGTGKWKGVTGSGEWTRTALQNSAAGAGASISVSAYSWKLP